MLLVGYKQRFSGVPFGKQRAEPEEKLFTTTRAKQWLLRGASSDYYTDYCIIQNIDDSGSVFSVFGYYQVFYYSTSKEQLFRNCVFLVSVKTSIAFCFSRYNC